MIHQIPLELSHPGNGMGIHSLVGEEEEVLDLEEIDEEELQAYSHHHRPNGLHESTLVISTLEEHGVDFEPPAIEPSHIHDTWSWLPRRYRKLKVKSREMVG